MIVVHLSFDFKENSDAEEECVSVEPEFVDETLMAQADVVYNVSSLDSSLKLKFKTQGSMPLI